MNENNVLSSYKRSDTDHSRRARQRVCLAAARLPVTEARGVKTLGCHLDKLLDARILEHVFLRGRRLEYHVK